MAVYKVLQDIEAEDKLIGPLTLRQFIYMAVALVCGWLGFMSYVKGVPFMIALLAPVALVAGFLAFPWGGDQPTEIWALSKLRFFLKPRKRIWDQDGQLDLVKITVPKRIEKNYTDGLSEKEVKSRLSALADTLDTRGWALHNQPHEISANVDGARLFDVSTTLPQPMIEYDQRPQDDIFDPQANKAASHLNQLVDSATQAKREAMMAQLNNPNPYNQPTQQNLPSQSSTSSTPSTDWFSPRENTMPVTTQATSDNHTDDTQEVKAKKETESQQTQATSTPPTAIINLASNNDLDIATLSRQANQQASLGQKPKDDDGEVVISLR